MGPADVVRAVLDFDEREVGDQVLVQEWGEEVDGKGGPVGGAVDNSVGTSILGQVIAEVGQPSVYARVEDAYGEAPAATWKLALSAASPIRSGAS